MELYTIGQFQNRFDLCRRSFKWHFIEQRAREIFSYLLSKTTNKCFWMCVKGSLCVGSRSYSRRRERDPRGRHCQLMCSTDNRSTYLHLARFRFVCSLITGGLTPDAAFFVFPDRKTAPWPLQSSLPAQFHVPSIFISLYSQRGERRGCKSETPKTRQLTFHCFPIIFNCWSPVCLASYESC
jgi:hypothetical protein